MIIDNLTSTEIYFEMKENMIITCNKNINNNGLIEKDSHDNNLISPIDIGDININKLTNYNGELGVLLYDDNFMKLVHNNEDVNIPINFKKGLKYLIEVKINEYNCDINQNFIITDDISQFKIFKIFLDNGQELQYRLEDNKIIILGVEKNYIDKFSTISVILYKDNKITNEITFNLEYLGYHTIFDKDSFFNGDYFEKFPSFELATLEEFSFTKNIVKEDIHAQFNHKNQPVINNINTSVDIQVFEANQIIDMIQYVADNEFRLIVANLQFGKIILINNCRVENEVSLNFEKEKNTKKTTLSCSNYIDIRTSQPSVYSKGKYGKMSYSSGDIWILNSSRR